MFGTAGAATAEREPPLSQLAVPELNAQENGWRNVRV